MRLAHVHVAGDQVPPDADPGDRHVLGGRGFLDIGQAGAVVDYPAFLSELDRLGRDVPLMMEHLDDADFAVARAEIFRIGDDVSISFVGRG